MFAHWKLISQNGLMILHNFYLNDQLLTQNKSCNHTKLENTHCWNNFRKIRENIQQQSYHTVRKFLQNKGKNPAAQSPDNFRKMKEIPFLRK
jgi:hypothetical protein